MYFVVLPDTIKQIHLKKLHNNNRGQCCEQTKFHPPHHCIGVVAEILEPNISKPRQIKLKPSAWLDILSILNRLSVSRSGGSGLNRAAQPFLSLASSSSSSKGTRYYHARWNLQFLQHAVGLPWGFHPVGHAQKASKERPGSPLLAPFHAKR